MMPTPIVITSTEVVNVSPPISSASVSFNTRVLHVVTSTVETPTLVDGRPT